MTRVGERDHKLSSKPRHTADCCDYTAHVTGPAHLRLFWKRSGLRSIYYEAVREHSQLMSSMLGLFTPL